MVERVPLTDDKLDELEKFARDNGNILALGFIAELRASRARERHHAELVGDLNDLITDLTADSDELQQRIDKALAIIAECEASDPEFRHLAVDGRVRAALTGTEAV